jgi:O-antigen/teichoic acid export membrane protein
MLDLEFGSHLFRFSVAIAFFDALALIPFALLRMKQQSMLFALLKLAVVLVNLVANIILVTQFHGGITGVFQAGVISSICGFVFLLPITKKHFQWEWNPNLVRSMMSFGLPTVPVAFSMIALRLADRPILKALDGNAAVALYQVNDKLALPMMLFFTVFEYAWKPFYLREAGTSLARKLFPKVLTYFIMVASIVAVVTSYAMPLIVRIPFGERFLIPEMYWSSLHIIPIIAFGYIFQGIYINLTVGVYLRKRTKMLPLITGFAALVKIAGNFLLIPSLSAEGAAWASGFAYAVNAGLLYTISFRLYPLRYEWGRVCYMLAISIAMYFLTVILTEMWTLSLGQSLVLDVVSIVILIGSMLVVLGKNELQELKHLKK